MPTNSCQSSSSERTLRSTGWLVVRLAWACELMLMTHELGHIGIAWFTGGRIAQTNLLPWVLPYTLVEPNPRPQLVAWGGVVGGCGVPLLLWGISGQMSRQASRFFAGLAGFCLCANGSYLAIGGGETLTDTGMLRSLGWSQSLLIGIGVALAIPGYWLCRRDVLVQHWRVEDGEIRWKRIAIWFGCWCLWIGVQAVCAFWVGAAGA